MILSRLKTQNPAGLFGSAPRETGQRINVPILLCLNESISLSKHRPMFGELVHHVHSFETSFYLAGAF